jgi:hypothetical protein
MAKTIPQLTDATTVNAEDELIVQQGGITKRATAAELFSQRLISLKDFGAVGDGVTDDTAAWTAFQAATGLKTVPAGQYLVNGNVIRFDNGAYGNGDVRTNLTAAQNNLVSTGITRITPRESYICIQGEHNNQNPRPALYVSSTINDSSNSAFGTRVAGIYSYIEQTGPATNIYPKSITGVSVNAASGDNDSTGIVGYSYKLNVAGGVGDAAGAGGVGWQYSTEEGLVIGGEFSAHQNVAGTTASNFMQSGNNTMSLHVTTNSTGSPCSAGIALDTFGLNAGRYGFWNTILIGRSCFAQNGAGAGIAGTVGINMAGCNTSFFPERAIFFGNAKHHIYRAGQAIRTHTTSLDVENTAASSVGLRLVTSTGSPQNRFIAAYEGSLGGDGSTSLTATGAITFLSTGRMQIASYESGNIKSRVELSESTDSFLPHSPNGTGSMGLGAASRLWSEVFAATGSINTSDERDKDDASNIPDEALDAWGRVNFLQYKFKSAIAQKGDGARVHAGVIAQNILSAFASEGLDATRYGLFCYDEWSNEPDIESVERVLIKDAVYEQIIIPAVIDEDGMEVKPAQTVDGEMIEPEQYETRTITHKGVEAGNRYGVRYEEALCFEAAYQRRRADRLEARIAAIEETL